MKYISDKFRGVPQGSREDNNPSLVLETLDDQPVRPHGGSAPSRAQTVLWEIRLVKIKSKPD